MDFSFFELFQLNDATFPIGSYAFSWGLETFVQQGIICDSASAKEYIQAELEGSFLNGELLTVRLAYEAQSAGGAGIASETQSANIFRKARAAEKLRELDEIYGASRAPFELREGSRKLANRFEKTVGAFCETAPFASGMERAGDAGISCTANRSQNYQAVYFPVAYGVHCAERGISLEECLAAFTYSQVSARVTTCVKLVPLSQSEGQRILYSLMKKFSALIAKCLSLSENDFCRSSPGLDLRAMQHEYLYSRLYSN